MKNLKGSYDLLRAFNKYRNLSNTNIRDYVGLWGFESSHMTKTIHN